MRRACLGYRRRPPVTWWRCTRTGVTWRERGKCLPTWRCGRRSLARRSYFTAPVSAYHRFSGSAPLPSTVPVRVQIGSVQAPVSYVGLVSNGLYQMNVTLPDLPDGDFEVIVTMGAEASPRGRYIPVKR